MTTDQLPSPPLGGDESTLEARLRGASSRLAIALDPELITGEVRSPVPSLPPQDSPAGRRSWKFLGVAAGLVLAVGAGGAVVASRQRTTGSSTIAAGAPVTRPLLPSSTFATADTFAAAADTTVAAASAAEPSVGALSNAPAPAIADGSPLQPTDKRRARPASPAAELATPAIPSAVPTAIDSSSTFALDVDTGSYTRLRDRLRAGESVDPAEVRTEELVNAFNQDYVAPSEGTFSIHVDGARVPFLPDDTRVVRVGIQGKVIPESQRKNASLTFVIDVSGSMEEDGKLELVKQSLMTLVDRLSADDRVAVVAFSDDAWIVLQPTSARDRNRIAAAINTLVPTNSTNAEAGLRLGYQLARISFDPGRSNRVILASDGVANVGPTGPEQISQTIREQAGKGIQLITVGVGSGVYNDPMMEQLADRGDGFYTYIDSPQQAQKVFSEQLVSTLQIIALDAKAQVSFDPAQVVAYRLLGYENRAVADDQFRNDSVDAGEIGAGHTVTAMYAIQLAPRASGNVGRVQLRWADPDTGKVTEIGQDINVQTLDQSLDQAAPRLVQDVFVAAWAEALRGGPWAARVDLSTLASRSPRLVELIPSDPQVRELVELIGRSAATNRLIEPSSPSPSAAPITLPW